MNKETRAEIKRQYKEEFHPKGIYCAKCNKTGLMWVDSSTNLTSSENRLKFSLKTRTLLNIDFQTALKDAGPESFDFEVLEVFEEDISQYELNKQLRERRIYWQDTLSAKSLYR